MDEFLAAGKFLTATSPLAYLSTVEVILDFHISFPLTVALWSELVWLVRFHVSSRLYGLNYSHLENLINDAPYTQFYLDLPLFMSCCQCSDWLCMLHKHTVLQAVIIMLQRRLDLDSKACTATNYSDTVVIHAVFSYSSEETTKVVNTKIVSSQGNNVGTKYWESFSLICIHTVSGVHWVNATKIGNVMQLSYAYSNYDFDLVRVISRSCLYFGFYVKGVLHTFS